MKESLSKSTYVYVAKFYDGANWSYMVSGAFNIFGTKKQAKEWIKENVTDKKLKRLYMYDLKMAGRKR